MVSIEPRNLEFPFNAIQEDTKIVHTKIIKIRNTTIEKARFGITFATIQRDFEVVHQKSGGVFPGEYEIVKVSFIPSSWESKQATFYVKTSSSDEMIPVYITAFPSLTNLCIPKNIHFGHTTLYESKLKKIVINNPIPVDFDFQFQVKNELPPNYFSISPLRGTIKGCQDTIIYITFIPLTLSQAKLEFQFSTSEYSFRPILCVAHGVGELEVPRPPPLPPKLKPIKPAVIHQPKKQVKTIEEALEGVDGVQLGDAMKKKSATLEGGPFSNSNGTREYQTTNSRIKVPPNVKLEPDNRTNNSKAANYLLLKFQNAAFKIVYRNRAEKRIKALKNSVVNGIEPRQKPTTKPKENIVCKITKLPIRLETPKKVEKIPLQIPPLPELFEPRPLPIPKPTYAERMGYKPLPIPKPKFTFSVQTPKPINDTQGSGTQPAELVDSHQVVPIEPLGYRKISLYNPIPGVAPMLYPNQTIPDESSFQYKAFMHDHKKNFRAIAELEADLECRSIELSHTYYDLFRTLHKK